MIALRGLRGKVALEQGWATEQELEQMAEALVGWGDDPNAFYGRPYFVAIGWA